MVHRRNIAVSYRTLIILDFLAKVRRFVAVQRDA
jgi:hypothetical protein